MPRDFTWENKQALYGIFRDMDLKEWLSFKSWCGTRAGDFGEWADKLDIASYAASIDNYQAAVQDTDSNTVSQMNTVFEGVNEIDRRYAQAFREYAEEVNAQIEMVQRMIQAMQSQSISKDINSMSESLYRMKPQTEVSYEESAEEGQKLLESYMKVSGVMRSEEQQKICSWIRERRPDMLEHLCKAAQGNGKDAVKEYHTIIDYYNDNWYRDVDYLIEQMVEENITSKEEMFSLSTYDLLARMIYQEMHRVEDGGQTKVLWVTINRYFSNEGDFTDGKENTLRNVLEEGGFAAIDVDEGHEVNAYRPNYDSEGWKNAKLLAAVLYSQIGEANAKDVDEEKVKMEISKYRDIKGMPLANLIGDLDSFWGDGTENHFYKWRKNNG